MHDELYEPLPDIDAYLERIGVTRVRKPSPEFLDELVFAHQQAVPFENLDVYERAEAPSLGTADLFDKIVTRRRGGYCFELNGLFYSLLAGLGFETRPSMARVLLRPTAHPDISHRANIVTLGGRDYLADVGFGGPMPAFAPILEDGSSRTELGQTFTMHLHEGAWWDVGFMGSSKTERIVLRACASPAEAQDFVALSFYQSQNPQSVFRQNRIVNIRTPTGAHDLRNATYTHFEGGSKTVSEIAGDEELDRLLADTFGISVWR